MTPSNRPSQTTTIAARAAMAIDARAAQQRATDVRIGLGYTAVQLEDGRAGVAFTFREAAGACCCAVRGERPLAGRPAPELARLVDSDNPIEAAVGLACVNAMANEERPQFREGDILDQLELRHGDNVAMVGRFEPLVAGLKNRVRSLTIFEKKRDDGVDIRPAEEAADALPRFQVALITATAIINHTMDDLLLAARPCREVAIVGASTPMLPDVFSAARVTLLSGVVIQRPNDVLRVVSEGGGMREFKRYVRKVNWRLRAVSSVDPA